ncbi:hypothetical protein LLG96_02570 [bacterium]|nr:hypothetical protein [bacterium]
MRPAMLNFSFLHKKAGNSIPERIQECLRTIQDDSDERYNESTIPPVNEQIKIRCIWVIELYPPSHIDNLLACIEKLNWNIPHKALPNVNVTKWIKDNRQSSFGSGFNLKYIKREKTSSIDRIAPMPDGFDGAFGTILQLIPSTTILMMQFLVNSEKEQILEKPLNKKYATYVEYNNGIYSYINPLQQKRIEVENIRKGLYDKCYEWFITHAPGVFSSGMYDGIFPTCEFTTLDVGIPFINTDSEYLRMLDFNDAAFIWKMKIIQEYCLKYHRITSMIIQDSIFLGILMRYFQIMKIN